MLKIFFFFFTALDISELHGARTLSRSCRGPSPLRPLANHVEAVGEQTQKLKRALAMRDSVHAQGNRGAVARVATAARVTSPVFFSLTLFFFLAPPSEPPGHFAARWCGCVRVHCSREVIPRVNLCSSSAAKGRFWANRITSLLFRGRKAGVLPAGPASRSPPRCSRRTRGLVRRGRGWRGWLKRKREGKKRSPGTDSFHGRRRGAAERATGQAVMNIDVKVGLERSARRRRGGEGV